MAALLEPPAIASVVIGWGVFGGRGAGWYVTVTMRAPARTKRRRTTHGPFLSLWEAAQIAATFDQPADAGTERAHEQPDLSEAV